jgi:MFS family permease
MLCSAVFQPIFASLTSFGQKHTILGALTFFTTGSIICALAKNATTLIAGRCLQGMGGGGLIILTYIVMAHLFSLEQRSQYTSLIGIIWTIGTICGPLIGGGFAGIGWVSAVDLSTVYAGMLTVQRWIFWLNLPFAAFTYILVICFMNIENKSQESVGSRLKRIDWVGCLLLSVALTLILIAISWVCLFSLAHRI